MKFFVSYPLKKYHRITRKTNRAFDEHKDKICAAKLTQICELAQNTEMEDQLNPMGSMSPRVVVVVVVTRQQICVFAVRRRPLCERLLKVLVKTYAYRLQNLVTSV